MVVDTTGNNEESEDKCDVEIIRPTKPALKAALKVIQSHLLRSQNGKNHIPKLDELEKFIDQSFDLQQTLITDFVQ